MTTRPMPRHATRYLDGKTYRPTVADHVCLWLVAARPNVPTLLRRLALPLVYGVLFFLFLCDEVQLYLDRISFRTIDKHASRASQIALVSIALYLVGMVLECILSGAFARAVLR